MDRSTLYNTMFSIVLLPINLYCSFWIFQEVLNLAGTTFHEFLRHFSHTSPLTGRNRLGKNQRRIFRYLAGKTSHPEKIRKLLHWYGISTLPAFAALTLAIYGAMSNHIDKVTYVLIGNIALVLINIALVIIGKLYRKKHPLDKKSAEILQEKRMREKETYGKYKIKSMIVYTFVGIFFMAVFIGILGGVNASYFQSSNGQPIHRIETVDFSDVHTVLQERGFETANIPTTYWSYDESKLTNVVAGIKEDTSFEFYEYSDGETTDGVYQKILCDIAADMKLDERERYETKLSENGKMFAIAQNGIYYLVIYQNNMVIYAYSPEGSSEINDILIELGYIEENKSVD